MTRSRTTTTIVLAVIVFAGALLRFNILWRSHAVIDADEAIVGLMAKHIVEGQGWPIFYYGQHYMGSLEPTLVAAAFKIFGIGSWALKSVPLIFSLTLIVISYHLAALLGGRVAGLLAALFTAIAPSALVVWSAMARGGFIEIVVIGSLALFIALRMLLRPIERTTDWYLLGLLLGVGWWVNSQILYYMVPIGLVVGVQTIRRTGFLRAFSLASRLFVTFLIGSAPFWYYNLFHKPRLASFDLFRTGGSGKFSEYLTGYFSEALPILLGARHFWGDVDLFPHAAIWAGALYGLLLIVALWQWRVHRLNGAALLVLGGFLVVVPIIFASSSFGWLSKAPRYLLPLYSVLFPICGIGVALLANARFYLLRGAAFALATGVLALNLYSNFGAGAPLPGQPFVYANDRVAEDHAPLYRWLAENDYNHIRTNYWIGYRVAFETNEAVTFSHYRGPGVVRIPEYEYESLVDDQSPLVLGRKESAIVMRGLLGLGLQFRRTQVGEYLVLDRFTSPYDGGDRIQPFAVTATHHVDQTAALLDDDPGTRWGSGAPQDPKMRIEFTFREPVELSGITIDFGFWSSDTPRDLLISTGGAEPCRLFDTESNPGLHYVLDGEHKWKIRFAPVTTSSVIFEQLGSDKIFDWSMAEVEFFQPPDKE